MNDRFSLRVLLEAAVGAEVCPVCMGNSWRPCCESGRSTHGTVCSFSELPGCQCVGISSGIL